MFSGGFKPHMVAGVRPCRRLGTRRNLCLQSVFDVQVVDECQKAVAWLQDKQRLQEGAKKSDDPVLLTADIRKKEDTLVRFAEPILNKPAPPPPKVWLTSPSAKCCKTM